MFFRHNAFRGLDNFIPRILAGNGPSILIVEDYAAGRQTVVRYVVDKSVYQGCFIFKHAAGYIFYSTIQRLLRCSRVCIIQIAHKRGHGIPGVCGNALPLRAI